MQCNAECVVCWSSTLGHGHSNGLPVALLQYTVVIAYCAGCQYQVTRWHLVRHSNDRTHTTWLSDALAWWLWTGFSHSFPGLSPHCFLSCFRILDIIKRHGRIEGDLGIHVFIYYLREPRSEISLIPSDRHPPSLPSHSLFCLLLHLWAFHVCQR